MGRSVQVGTKPSRRAVIQAALGLACVPRGAWAEMALPVPHPPSVVGDRWTYRFVDDVDASQEMTYEHRLHALNDAYGFDVIQDVVIAAKVESKVGRRGVRPRERATFLDWPAEARRPGVVLLRFPLSAGSRWDYGYEQPGGNGATYQEAGRANVIGAESLNVPAGTFETLRVEIVATWAWRGPGVSSSGTIEQTLWYAPAVRNFVRRDHTRRVSGSPFPVQARSRAELVGFELKPA